MLHLQRVRSILRCSTERSHVETMDLYERPRLQFVTLYDSIGTHVRECLNSEGWIEAGSHRWKRRATYDEHIWNVPTLAVTIDHGIFRITSHASAALMVRTRCAATPGGTPYKRPAHSMAKFFQLVA